MNDNKKVLEQVDIIESTLIDSNKFMPYNYNILILWGFVSALLFLTFENIMNISILYGFSYLFFIILSVMLIEYYYTRKENNKYDLSKYTSKQRFIESIYFISMLFSSLLTYILIINNVSMYSYFIWIFMIAFSNYISSFILNNKYFKQIGILNILVTFILLIVYFIFKLEFIEENIKLISVVFSSFGCIYIGIMSKKYYKV